MSKQCTIVGVGPGLGLAVAERFAQEGYQIVMVSRRALALQEYTAKLAQIGAKAVAFSADVSDFNSLEKVFKQIIQTIGVPEVLVYNAANITEFDPLTLSPETLVQEFKVDVVGALTSIQEVVPGMRLRGNGTILLTGGGLALDNFSFPSYLPLSISKAGLRKLSFLFADTLRNDNIHVATVTICNIIKSGTHFDPEKIAEVYWQLHTQPKSTWQLEYVYK